MGPLVVAGGAAVLGGIANFFANKSAQERAQMLQDKGLQQWLSIHIPDPAQQQIALQKFVVQGVLDPKLEQAIQADPSAFTKIIDNQKYVAAQDRALGELEDIGHSGGLRLQDKAGLQDARMHAQVDDRAGRNAIAADMARKGQGGSGFEVAAQLQGQSAVADREGNASLKIAADAQDRALKSIEDAGSLAGQYQTQGFNRNSARAAAEDKINLFNTNNLQDVQQRNVGQVNHAAEMNLAQKQKTADQNTTQSNYEQEYNKKLAQQKFENDAKVAAGASGQYGAMANNAVKQGESEGNFYSNMAGGVSGAATAQAGADFWDNYFKKKKGLDDGSIYGVDGGSSYGVV